VGGTLGENVVKLAPSLRRRLGGVVYFEAGYFLSREKTRIIMFMNMPNRRRATCYLTGRAKKAIVVLIGEYTPFNKIISGLEWSRFQKFTSNYHQAKWALLTDGIDRRIFISNI
jgi:hypothetical protein